MRSLFQGDADARRRRDRVLGAIFLFFLVFLVARAARKDGGVLVRNQEFGGRFLAGEDPYFDPARGHRVHGPYPPSFVLVAAPLSLLPTPLARIAWGSAQALALVAAFVVLRRWSTRFWPSAAPHAPVLFAAAILLASRYLLRDSAGGGGNLLFAMLALVGLDLAFAGRGALAGLPLALSLVLKPNLAPLLLFLAFRRRWTSLASTLILGAALFLLPAAWFGLEDYLDLAARWTRDVASYAAVEDPGRPDLVPDGMPVSDSSMNQSLREASGRLARAVGASPSLAAWTARAVALALGAAACAVALRARPGRREVLAALAFLPLALLLSPISWKAHHVALLPLFFALACEAFMASSRTLTILLGATWVACGLLSEEIVGETAKEVLQGLSIVTIFDVLLLAAALVHARSSDEAP
ncbi:MAG: glycosyltransferase family 87 protein [Planctomycetota bacterium]